MRDDRFEWDDAKAASNLRKHRVSFDQAREVFDDPDGQFEIDDDPDEDRWKLTGRSAVGILVVVHVERGTRIRIISARGATRREEAGYHRQASAGR